MQIKKRYVVVAVLLLLGLTTFTFASPRQVEKQKSSKGISERVTNDKKENRSYAEALDAVEKAEENPTLETVETARNEIQNADDATVEQINQLEQRVEVVEETIDVAALVKEVETLAEVKETRETAKAKYPNAETEVNKLEEGDVKDNLVSRLEKVSRLLNDTEAPVVTGIEEMPTNKNEIVYVKDEFLQSVTIDGVEYTEFTIEDDVLKFEKKVTKEGTHTVVAIDKLGNETTKTFTIDKTAAKKNAVNANVNGYKNDVKEQYAINGKTVTAYITVTEELKENPTFTFYANGKKIATVKEEVVAGTTTNTNYPYKYTAKLVINEELVAEDGQLTFTVTNIEDKAGNKTADISKLSVNGKVLTLDRTAPARKSTDFYVSGLTQVGKTFYTQYGKKVVVNITTDEELKDVPTFTLHNAGNDYIMEDAKYRGINDKGYHLYQASLVLSKEAGFKDGNVTFTVSNIRDKAGNVKENIIEPTNGRKVVLDNELNVEKLALVGGTGLWSKDHKSYNQYATNGTTIYVNARFYEELAETPVVTLNDKINLTKASKKQSGNIWIYSYTYKIKEDDGLVDGQVKVNVKNIKDFAGNTAELTNENATMTSQKTIIIDRTNPTYRFTKLGSSLVKDEIKPIEVNGVFYFEEPVRVTLSDAINLRLHGVDSYSDDKNTARTGWLTDVRKSGEHTAVAEDSVGNRTEFKFVVGAIPTQVENNELNLNENITLVNKPFYNDNSATEEVVINGNGKTVTQYVTDADQFNWRDNWTIPVMGDVFSSKTGTKVTVNNLNLKGTIQSVMLGNYVDSKSDWFNTEFNNVNIVGVDVVSLSSNIAPAAVVYGKAVLNNTNIYGTKLSALDTYPRWAVYDFAAVNSSNTTINGGKYGSMYLWAKAVMTINNAEVDVIDNLITTGHLEIGDGSIVNRINMNGTNAYKPDVTVKAGATVKVLDISKVTNFTDIIIEEGAIVETVITTDGEMSYEAWAHGIETPEELKSKLSSGEDIILKKDITLTDEPLVIAKGKEVEINLNGKKITGRSTNASASKLITVNEGATLKLTGEGTIDFTAGKPDTNWGGEGQLPFPGYSSNTIYNIGKLIIDGPTIINNTARGGASYAIDNYQGSELIVKSGKIYQTGGDQALRIFANSNTLTTSLTIEGGEIVGRRALWIQLPNSNPDRAPKVNVNITGGTLKSTDTGADGYNLAIYSYSYGESFKNVNVNITGGEFFGHVAFGGGSKNGQENVNVTGGVFHNDLGRYLANDGWEDITKPE